MEVQKASVDHFGRNTKEFITGSKAYNASLQKQFEVIERLGQIFSSELVRGIRPLTAELGKFVDEFIKPGTFVEWGNKIQEFSQTVVEAIKKFAGSPSYKAITDPSIGNIWNAVVTETGKSRAKESATGRGITGGDRTAVEDRARETFGMQEMVRAGFITPVTSKIARGTMFDPVLLKRGFKVVTEMAELYRTEGMGAQGTKISSGPTFKMGAGKGFFGDVNREMAMRTLLGRAGIDIAGGKSGYTLRRTGGVPNWMAEAMGGIGWEAFPTGSTGVSPTGLPGATEDIGRLNVHIENVNEFAAAAEARGRRPVVTGDGD